MSLQHLAEALGRTKALSSLNEGSGGSLRGSGKKGALGSAIGAGIGTVAGSMVGAPIIGAATGAAVGHSVTEDKDEQKKGIGQEIGSKVGGIAGDAIEQRLRRGSKAYTLPNQDAATAFADRLGNPTAEDIAAITPARRRTEHERGDVNTHRRLPGTGRLDDSVGATRGPQRGG